MGNFTKLQIEWSRQVRHDHKLPARALHVADALAFDFMNRDKLEAWPAMDTLCERVGLSEKTVRAVLGALEERGHLIKKSGGGRKKSNRYRWIIKDKNTGKNAGVSDGKTPAKTKEFTRPKRKPNSGSFGSKTPAYLPEEPSEENRFKGGSAHGRASAYINGAVSSSSEDIEVIDAYAADHVSDRVGTQGHEAPVPDPLIHDAEPDPSPASDIETSAPEPDPSPEPAPELTLDQAEARLAISLGDEDAAHEIMRNSIMGFAGWDDGAADVGAKILSKLVAEGRVTWPSARRHVLAIVVASGADGERGLARLDAALERIEAKANRSAYETAVDDLAHIVGDPEKAEEIAADVVDGFLGRDRQIAHKAVSAIHEMIGDSLKWADVATTITAIGAADGRGEFVGRSLALDFETHLLRFAERLNPQLSERRTS